MLPVNKLTVGLNRRLDDGKQAKPSHIPFSVPLWNIWLVNLILDTHEL